MDVDEEKREEYEDEGKFRLFKLGAFVPIVLLSVVVGIIFGSRAGFWTAFTLLLLMYSIWG